MIQRIQSLYLLLAAAAGIGTWFLNIWKATLNDGSIRYFNAQSSFIVFLVLMLVVGLALFCIFLFKNRKLQFRLTILNILLSVVAIALQYFKVQDTANDLQSQGKLITTATYLPGAFLPVLIFIFLLMAARGIFKDEKLIKSLDRLR
jgi:FlaA1/EpsC-like NDP-sugar epimerase